MLDLFICCWVVWNANPNVPSKILVWVAFSHSFYPPLTLLFYYFFITSNRLKVSQGINNVFCHINFNWFWPTRWENKSFLKFSTIFWFVFNFYRSHRYSGINSFKRRWLKISFKTPYLKDIFVPLRYSIINLTMVLAKKHYPFNIM